jgi:hypothetical protein
MSANPPNFLSEVEAALQDPSLRLEACLDGYQQTENPVYMWEAIKLCTEHSCPLPDLVSAYLGAVAKRMLSDEVRQCSDLRKVLPHVLGFPKKRRGPGRLLDPYSVPDDRAIFAMKFLCKLGHDREPEPAFEEACNEMDASFACAEEDTLWGWIMEELGLAEKPKTNAEWHAAARAHYFPFFALVKQWSREHLGEQEKQSLNLRKPCGK